MEINKYEVLAKDNNLSLWAHGLCQGGNTGKQRHQVPRLPNEEWT